MHVLSTVRPACPARQCSRALLLRRYNGSMDARATILASTAVMHNDGGPDSRSLMLGTGLVAASACGLGVAAYNGGTDRVCENEILEVRWMRTQCCLALLDLQRAC